MSSQNGVAPVSSTSIRIISITGGKGGVGKTNIAVNVAIALAKLQHKVMLFDADLGLANVDVLLGLHAKKNLYSVLKGECALTDIQIEGPAGIKIIPSASGIEKMVELNAVDYANLIRAFSSLTQEIDVLLIDTAAGISHQVLNFIRAAQEIMVVICDEPTSLADGYALIKVLNTKYNIKNFNIVANMVNNAEEGRDVYARLYNIGSRFLNVNLSYLGFIPRDIYLPMAVKQHKAVMTEYPAAKSSVAFSTLAKRIMQSDVKNVPDGHISFFFERLVKANQLLTEWND